VVDRRGLRPAPRVGRTRAKGAACSPRSGLSMMVLVDGNPAAECPCWIVACSSGRAVRDHSLPPGRPRSCRCTWNAGIRLPTAGDSTTGSGRCRGGNTGVGQWSRARHCQTSGDGREGIARGYARSGSETATRITIRYPWPHDDRGQLHDGVMASNTVHGLARTAARRVEALQPPGQIPRARARERSRLVEGILFSSSEISSQGR